MVRFLRTTFRNFRKDKLFTGINILGLTLGMSCALMIFMIARHDLQFDTFHHEVENIYRVSIKATHGDDVNYDATCPAPTGPAMVSDFSEVKDYTRINARNGVLVEIGDEQFSEENRVASVQASFFDMFNFPILMGDAKLLNQPNQVFLSESWALKYFVTDNYERVIGKQFTIDRNLTVQVAGVMKDFPLHTDLPFDMLISEASFSDEELGLNAWNSLSSDLSIFIRINEGTDIDELQAGFPDFLKEHAGERMSSFIALVLQPMSTIHFDERFGNYNERTTPPRILWGLLIIGGVLLITACINFINLSTANAIKRSKEVGIRKVLGVTRVELVGKFFGETAIITLISILLAVPVTLLIQPAIEGIVGYSFEFNIFSDPSIWVAITFIGIIVVLISGFYPAFITSGYSASETIKSNFFRAKSGNSNFRRVLVVTQFVISQVLLIGLFVIQSQLSYFINAEMGFDKDGVMTLNLPQDKIAKGQALKNELLTLSPIKKVSLANGGASSGNIWAYGFRFAGAAPGEHHTAQMKMADTDYLSLYGFELLAGRNYFKSDSIEELLINRAMAEEMGFNNPQEAIGEKVSFGGPESENETVVGVLENFYTNSLYEEVSPTVITTTRENYSVVNLKVDLTNLSETIEQMEVVWHQVFPNDTFNYVFLDDQIREYYDKEERLSEIIMWFTIVALFIGGMGLYGLITYVVNKRMKELGIRKVMGASFANLFSVISKEFVYLVVGAFLLAGPIAWYLGNEWLSGYDNRIEMGALVFVMALVSSVLVALLAILHKSIIATRVNPVEILRNE